MHIFELKYPGMTIVLSDRDTDWVITGLIDDIESSFTEAAVALNLFESEQQRRHEELHEDDAEKRGDPDFLMKKWEQERNKNIEINFRAAEPRGIKRKDSVALNLLLRLDF